MKLKNFELTNAEGKRNTSVCNSIRKQMIEKTMSVLADADMEPVLAANGDISVPVCIDSATGLTYYFRLSPSFSGKDLDSKIAKKKPEKPQVEMPVLFD